MDGSNNQKSRITMVHNLHMHTDLDRGQNSISLHGHNYTVFSTCVRTSAKHKLDFPQNNIHDTDFYTCTRQNLCTNLAVQASSYNIAFYAYTHTSVMHKIVFSSVEIPYTVLCASSGTSEEHKIEVHSVDRHYKHSTAKANQACKCKH